MINILKAEVKKLLKSTSFLAIVILTIFLPIFMAGTYKVLERLALFEEVPLYGTLFSPLGAFMTSFSPVDNFGLIILIIIVFTLSSDFGSGTIRNKVIGGYSRNEVYLSSTVFTLGLITIFSTLYSILTYLFVGLFIGFENTSFLVLLRFYLNAIFSIWVIYAFVQLIVYKFKSLGASLGIILGILFIGVLIPYSVLSMGMTEKTNRIVLLVFPFLQIFVPKLVEGLDFFIMLLVSLCYLSGFIYLGLKINKRTDYK